LVLQVRGNSLPHLVLREPSVAVGLF
jgi:hypothetical protein